MKERGSGAKKGVRECLGGHTKKMEGKKMNKVIEEDSVAFCI